MSCWSVELEPEVERWMSGLAVRDFAAVTPRVEQLAERGSERVGR